MSKEKQEAAKYRKDFIDVVEQLAEGQVNKLLGERFRELVAAVEETSKSGKMVVTFTVAKSGGQALVAVDYKLTKPEHGSPKTILFFGTDGSLMREDPRQLPLRRVVEHQGFDPRQFKVQAQPEAIRQVEEAVDIRAAERAAVAKDAPRRLDPPPPPRVVRTEEEIADEIDNESEE